MNTEKPHFQAKKALGRTTPCTVSKRSPKLRHHKATGQAYVVLNGNYIFFGPYGSPDVAEQYHRTIAEMVSHDTDEQNKVLKIFDFSQIAEVLWNGSNFSQKRALLQIVSLNRQVSDVTLCLEKTKPFDALAKQSKTGNIGRYWT